MNKKYRFKIDTPWGDKGTILSLHESSRFYPDLFEEVFKPDPVEKVAKWLFEEKYPMHGKPLIAGASTFAEWHELGPEQDSWRAIALELIAAGLDPKKLVVE